MSVEEFTTHKTQLVFIVNTFKFNMVQSKELCNQLYIRLFNDLKFVPQCVCNPKKNGKTLENTVISFDVK